MAIAVIWAATRTDTVKAYDAGYGRSASISYAYANICRFINGSRCCEFCWALRLGAEAIADGSELAHGEVVGPGRLGG